MSWVLSRRSAVAGIAVLPAAAMLPRPLRAAGAGKIVSLGGAATEILYALGCGDRIVGVDVTSRYPADATKKPSVGYYRSLSAEGVLALAPDLVVATDGAGPKEAIDVLSAASVKFVQLAEIRQGADIGARIRTVAEAVGEAERGEAFATTVEADLASLEASLKSVSPKRKALVLLGPPRGGALMAAGSGSTGGVALALAGAENAAAATNGWKPLSDEAAYGLEPDAIVVLATSGPVDPGEIARRPGLAQSPAVRDGRVIVADALGFVGFGPRVAHAIREVAAKIYPETPPAPLPPRAWAADALQAK